MGQKADAMEPVPPISHLLWNMWTKKMYGGHLN